MVPSGVSRVQQNSMNASVIGVSLGLFCSASLAQEITQPAASAYNYGPMSAEGDARPFSGQPDEDRLNAAYKDFLKNSLGVVHAAVDLPGIYRADSGRCTKALAALHKVKLQPLHGAPL